eukprot:6419156-Amphidinium_carterae.1
MALELDLWLRNLSFWLSRQWCRLKSASANRVNRRVAKLVSESMTTIGKAHRVSRKANPGI